MRRLCTLSIFSIFLALTACGKKSAPKVDGDNKGDGGDDKKPKVDYQAKFDQLMLELKRDEPGRRRAAIAGIVEYKDEAIPSLIEALADKGVSKGPLYPGQPGSTREAAVMALVKIGPAGEKALIDTGLGVLLDGLLDPNPAVLERTIVAIGLIGPKAKAASKDVSKHCASTNDGVRHAAYETLTQIKDIPVGVVLSLLTNPEPKVAADAARALSSIRPLPKEVIPELVFHLKVKPELLPPAEEYVFVRNEIADALASFGEQAKEAVPALIEVVRVTTREEMQKYHLPGRRTDDTPAMTALRRIGKPAVAQIVELLKSEKPFVRAQAARILGGIGPDAKDALEALQTSFDKEITSAMRDFDAIAATALAQVQIGGDHLKPVFELAKLLNEKEDMVRLATLRELARFGRKAESVVQAIIPMLDDKAESIGVQAAETLRAIGPAAKAAIPALTKKLADDDLQVRRTALKTIRSFGPIAADTVADVTKLLADKDDAFRREVVEVIVAFGPAAKMAVPDLAKLLKNDDERERMVVLQALAAIGPDAKSAAADMLPILGVRDREIRMQALETLGRIGNASPEVLTAITGRLKDDYQIVRVYAARALALLGPSAKDAVPALKGFAAGNPKYPDRISPVWAATALYRIGIDSEANLKIVVDAIRNTEPAGRLARLEAIDAAEYLGAGAKAILPDLISALSDNTPIRPGDKTPVRLRAIVAIGKMGPAAKEAVSKLSNMLKESDETIKRAALEALGQMGPTAAFALPRLREIIRTEPEFAEQAQMVLDRIEAK
jgi:HEAT repeat protein